MEAAPMTDDPPSGSQPSLPNGLANGQAGFSLPPFNFGAAPASSGGFTFGAAPGQATPVL